MKSRRGLRFWLEQWVKGVPISQKRRRQRRRSWFHTKIVLWVPGNGAGRGDAVGTWGVQRGQADSFTVSRWRQLWDRERKTPSVGKNPSYALPPLTSWAFGTDPGQDTREIYDCLRPQHMGHQKGLGFEWRNLSWSLKSVCGIRSGLHFSPLKRRYSLCSRDAARSKWENGW